MIITSPTDALSYSLCEPSAGQMLDELAWWARVTRQGRLDEAATQAAS